MRDIRLEPGIAPHALASILATFGRTQVICAVTLEDAQPRWKKDQGLSGGWVTAEYSMLPYSTPERKKRDRGGSVDGRSVEIQRLIGRSLRSVVDMDILGERTVCVDCDVLCADGGTRTAGITGAAAALYIALQRLVKDAVLPANPMHQLVAAISVGLRGGVPLLDLCYAEDCDADVDMNVVMTEHGEYVEVQGNGEEAVFTARDMQEMLRLADVGVQQLLKVQRTCIAACGCA